MNEREDNASMENTRMDDTKAVLYRGGTVYSDADRFATAMLIEQGTISWIGDEQGADVHLRAGAAIVNLDSRLLTPAFGDSITGGDVHALEWTRQGVALVLTEPGAEPPAEDDGPDALLERVPRNPWARVSSDPSALTPGELACIDPTTLGLDVDLAALAAQGLPLAFGTAAGEPISPWRRVQHALARGLSARAGFLASTRGVWRASSAADAHSRGRLMVGAPATFVVWDHTELVTQVADERRSAWSSDARAGLAPLPALGALDDSAWQSPRCLRTVVNGQTAFDVLPSD